MVALMIGLTASVAGAIPGLLSATAAADVRESVFSLSATTRDMSASFLGVPATAVWPDLTREGLYGVLDSTIRDMRSKTDDPLRALLTSPELVVISRDPIGLYAADPNSSPGKLQARLAADPDGAQRIHYVDGVAPGPWQFPARPPTSEDTVDNAFGNPTSPQPDVNATATTDHPFEIALSQGTASDMRLRVGDELRSPLGILRVSGIFTPSDPGDSYWAHVTGVQNADVTNPSNDTPVFTATAFINPLSVGALIISERFALYSKFWWPIAADGTTSQNAALVAEQVHRFTQTRFPLSGIDGGPNGAVSATSSLGDAIDASTTRIHTTLNLLSLCVAGPIGAVLAVVAISIRAIATRRQAVTRLVRARGASKTQLRVSGALEGVLTGFPVAVIGAVVGTLVASRLLLVEGDSAGTDVEGWIAAILIGTIPCVFLALNGSSVGHDATEEPRVSRVRARTRIVVELAIVLLSALAVGLVVRRGAVSTAGVDPLVTVAPLLLALATGVLVMRVLPLISAASATVARRRRGAVLFIAAARSIREPAVGLSVAFAVVLGLAFGICAGVTLTSIDETASTSAHNDVGADIRASGSLFSSDEQARVAAVPGVVSVAPVATAGSLELGGTSVTVLLTETDAMRAQRPELPNDLAELSNGRIPVVVSSDLIGTQTSSPELALGANLRLGNVDAIIAGVLDASSGIGVGGGWIVVDKAFAKEVGATRFAPSVLLVQAVSEADVLHSAAAIRAALPGVRVDDVAAVLSAWADTPSAVALRVVLIVSALSGAVLAALALFVGSVAAARARARTIGTLRTMGMPASSTGRLVVWEIAIPAIGASLAGSALGLVLPWLILACSDLGPFSGGSAPSSPTYDFGQIALIFGSYLVIVALSTICAVLMARRTSPATTLKMGEE